MANQTPIAKWVFANRATFHPVVEQITWPDRYYPGVHDFATTIEVSGEKIVGRGLDRDPLIAVEKSFAEAIERLVCTRLKINSEGLSVGSVTESAERIEKHARSEVLERHFFFKHLREYINFRPSVDRWTAQQNISKTFREYNENYAEPRLFDFLTPKGVCGHLIVIDRDKQPAFVGLSYGRPVEASIWHAFLEAMPNFARFRDSPSTFDSEVAECRYWNCDPNFMAEVARCLRSGSYPKPVTEVPEIRRIGIDVNQIPELLGAPIIATRFVIDEGKVAVNRDRSLASEGEL